MWSSANRDVISRRRALLSHRADELIGPLQVVVMERISIAPPRVSHLSCLGYSLVTSLQATEEAELLNELCDISLCSSIVTGEKYDSASASLRRVQKPVRWQNVKRLHQSSARNKIGHDLARCSSAQVGHFKIRWFGRIGRIDDDPVLSWWKVGERLSQMHPRHGQYDDFRRDGFFDGARTDSDSQISHQRGQGFWSTAVAGNDVIASLASLSGQGLPDSVRADDADFQDRTFLGFAQRWIRLRIRHRSSDLRR
jgi:hypothetical protein